jgi:predicted aminopeptidase
MIPAQLFPATESRLGNRLLRVMVMTLACLVLQACSTMSFYAQSVTGQLEVLAKRRPIDAAVEDPNQTPERRAQLRRTQRMRDFAVASLGLPDNDSYRSYADLRRRFVIYNVFATPELSLEPVRSCFLVVGCLDYRGYFRERMARRHAAGLKAKGNDVYVGGVAAYSTLGWFDDPVLSSMLDWDEARLAKFLFHELAHQRLYVKNDTAFNEAFAETVAEVGLERWLTAHVAATEAARLRQAEEREQVFVRLILDARQELLSVYDSAADDATKRQGKRGAFRRFQDRYAELRRNWGNDPTYDSWAFGELNNAKFNAVATYHDAIPAFRTLLALCDGDLTRFYDRAARLGKLPTQQRSACLSQLAGADGSAPDACAALTD